MSKCSFSTFQPFGVASTGRDGGEHLMRPSAKRSKVNDAPFGFRHQPPAGQQLSRRELAVCAVTPAA